MAIEPKAGMRVLWGDISDSKRGVLVCPAMDEDDDTPMLCSSCEPPLPLWQIKFDDGTVKRWCCPSSIMEVEGVPA